MFRHSGCVVFLMVSATSSRLGLDTVDMYFPHGNCDIQQIMFEQIMFGHSGYVFS